jgi:S1-C subfamily serine protease
VSVVSEVLPSVVQITTTKGLGSGVVLDDQGDIVTNAHVVDDATTFQVRLANSATPVPASLVGSYLPDDLAVIHLDTLPSPAPKAARFADSAALRVGDTLAAVDPQVGRGGSAAPGIGFAIPSNLVKDIAGQLVANHGHVANSHRAQLGVSVITVVGQDGEPQGAGVAAPAPGGAARKAGIKVGEIITKIADTDVHTAADLVKAPAGLDAGKGVPVELTDPATGKTRTVTVTLDQLPGI